jgi:hypothetical protein
LKNIPPDGSLIRQRRALPKFRGNGRNGLLLSAKLLRGVSSIESERLGQVGDMTDGGGQEVEPGIMQASCGKRDNQGHQAFSKSQAVSGENALASDQFELIFWKAHHGLMQPFWVPLTLLQGIAFGLESFIHDYAVAGNSKNMLIGFQERRQALDVLGKPAIVLIGEQDDVIAAAAEGIFEVGDATACANIRYESHRKGDSLGELLDDGPSVIGGVVVAYDQLIGQPGLG